MTENRGEVKWMTENQYPERNDKQNVVDARYSRVGERIRHITPSALQCSMFCGGKQCKYDNPGRWKEEEMAIKGLYSSWITNDILAMARPSTYAIKEYDVINQFKVNGIATVINLQHPGEHASCGFGLEDGGFSYIPQQFMDEDVFFYNFCWDDYGVRALQSILDMVKVMDFARKNGKVAIHCHAGLGRTGVLIACYFVYSQRMKGNAAINVVRAKRPRAIQTRGQIACVRDFEKYLQPMWIIYSHTISNQHKPFTLSQFLRRQANILHGEEERDLRYVPKVVFIISQRLLQLSGFEYDLKNVAIFRRRTLGSLSLSGLAIDDTCSDQQRQLLVNQNRRVRSDSLIEHARKENDKEMLNIPVEGDVFYDSFADESEGVTDMDELSPEQFLRHSVSESVLFKSTKDSKAPADAMIGKHKSLQNIRSKGLDQSTKIDEDNNYENIDNARSSDADEGITIDAKNIGQKPDSVSSIQLIHDKTGLNSNRTSQKSLTSKSIELSSAEKSFIRGEEGNTKARNLSCASMESCTQSIYPSLLPKVSYSRVSTLLEKYKIGLNTTEAIWEQISNEENAFVLSSLLWNWLEHLEEPIITKDDIEVILKDLDDPVKAFEQLDRGKRKTLQVVLFTFLKISQRSDDFKIKVLQKIVMVFTKHASLLQKTRSEKAVLDQNARGRKARRSSSLAEFLDFIIKLSNSELFDTL